VGGLQKPLGVASVADGTGRLFVLEQAGRVQVVQNGQVLPAPYLDITDRVGSSGNEQGLLGLDFHPRYTENGFFYANYTDRNGDTVIARFQVSPDDPNRADPDPFIRPRPPFAAQHGSRDEERSRISHRHASDRFAPRHFSA